MSTEINSVGLAQHSEPTFTLYGPYLAALLRSMMGYVPELKVAGYQMPGWEEPMPLHFFKGEALR